MSSIKVVDINEEVKEEPPEPIEEEEQQQPDITNEVVEEVGKASLNSNPVGVEVVEVNEEPKQEQVGDFLNSNKVGVEPKEIVEEQPKAKPKAKPKASDIVKCDKCEKSMSYKNLRYSHNCDPKPVKKQANPKGKAKPKQPPKLHEVASKQRAPPDVYYSESDDDEPQPQQPMLKKKNKQPAQQTFNPTATLAQQYQFLQNQMIQQKQERYNNLCMNMFSAKLKMKR